MEGRRQGGRGGEREEEVDAEDLLTRKREVDKKIGEVVSLDEERRTTRNRNETRRLLTSKQFGKDCMCTLPHSTAAFTASAPTSPTSFHTFSSTSFDRISPPLPPTSRPSSSQSRWTFCSSTSPGDMGGWRQVLVRWGRRDSSWEEGGE